MPKKTEKLRWPDWLPPWPVWIIIALAAALAVAGEMSQPGSGVAAPTHIFPWWGWML